MFGSNIYDFVGFTPSQSGPGGAAVLSYGEVGGGGANAAGPLPAGSVAVAPSAGRGWSFPPVIWMFVFLIVGYWDSTSA